jgi:hypothetical protein
MILRHLASGVSRAGVGHDDFVSQAADRFQRFRQFLGGISRDDGNR